MLSQRSVKDVSNFSTNRYPRHVRGQKMILQKCVNNNNILKMNLWYIQASNHIIIRCYECRRNWSCHYNERLFGAWYKKMFENRIFQPKLPILRYFWIKVAWNLRKYLSRKLKFFIRRDNYLIWMPVNFYPSYNRLQTWFCPRTRLG